MAPVRETCAQALGAALRHLDPGAVEKALQVLLQLVACRAQWEVRHSGLAPNCQLRYSEARMTRMTRIESSFSLTPFFPSSSFLPLLLPSFLPPSFSLLPTSFCLHPSTSFSPPRSFPQTPSTPFLPLSPSQRLSFFLAPSLFASPAFIRFPV